MKKKFSFYQKHKLFLEINKSSSEFYGSSKYKKLIQEKYKINNSKLNSPFTLNQNYNNDLMSNAHRILLHSKIKSNPKYDKLEIECYTCKKQKNIDKNKDIFLTTNMNKNVKKSRNIDNFFKINEIKDFTNKTNYKERKSRTINSISSKKFEMNKYYFDTKRNIKEFVDERRIMNRLKYINKLKTDLKEKRENEKKGELKLYYINCISLIKSKNLLTQFETDRNYYNRHLLNDLMNNKQILLKILLKQNILEGEIINLKKKIDDLKGKTIALKGYKKFLLCIKNHTLSRYNYVNKSFKKRNTLVMGQKNNDKNNDSNNLSRNSIKKAFSFHNPLLKKNSLIVKQKNDNKKDKRFYKKVTFENYNNETIKEHFLTKDKKTKSESQIFESTKDFYNKMNRIEENLLTSIYKNNKIRRQITKMKIMKTEELNSLKKNYNIEIKKKLYEELLNSYKDYNNTLENKLKLLTAEKENNSYISLIFKKINEILIEMNKSSKLLHHYDKILIDIKNLLNKRKIMIKTSYIFKGIIILEKFINEIKVHINNNPKKINEENIIEKIKCKIEKEKKMNIDREKKEEIIRNLKLNKILAKNNKICITSRKVPEKINFFKKNESKKNK